ncbi:MAG: hypothetical protein IPO43_04905 [Rhodoferax sp.]|nr:hypothetical protein [Rhodoferax sp.]
MLDSFVETTAQVDKVSFERVLNRKYGTTLSRKIYIVGRYQAQATEYTIIDTHDTLYNSSDGEAAARALALRRTLITVSVFYDPARPERAVLHKSSIPTLAEVTIMGLLGGVILVMCTGLVLLGGAGLLAFVAPGSSAMWAGLNTPRRSTVDLNDAPQPTSPLGDRAQAPKPESKSLTGDASTDYYSGALAHHASGHWEGCWCELFLVADKVIVVYNESTHHWFETVGFADILEGRVQVHFDDHQQAQRESFLQRIQQERCGR